MSRMPETFTSMKAKMNGSVAFAIEHMNSALEKLCLAEDTSPKVILKATQEYLALYMKMQNEIQKEIESKEIMKQRRLNTKIKEAEVADIENPTGGGIVDSAVKQSKFSPTMSKYN